MDSNFFALISRMRYIERWSLMRNSIHENIQEHSHMVAVLAHALAVIRNRVYGGQIDAALSAVMCSASPVMPMPAQRWLCITMQARYSPAICPRR